MSVRGPGGRRISPVIALGWLVGFLALFAGYLYAERFVTQSSDQAGVVLEGQAMLHGNVILHGWQFGPDPFIGTEALLDALGSVFFSGAQLLKLSPALLYAATVVLAVSLAVRCVPASAARSTGWLAAGACAALVAFPVGPLFGMDLVGALHIATVVAGLIAFVAYDQFVRRPAAVGLLGLFVLLATLAILGDPMAELVIPVPVGIVSALVLWRTRGQPRKDGREGERTGGRPLPTALARWHSLPTAWATLGAAVLALVLGLGVRELLMVTGAHYGSATPQLASPDLVWQHVVWLAGGLCALFHIVLWSQMGYAQRVPFIVLNAGFFLVAMAGFVLLLRRTLVPRALSESLSSVVSWAVVADVAAFMFTNFAENIGGLRYLLPAFIYLGILCYAALSQVVVRRYLGQFVLAFLAVSGLTFGVMLANAAPETVIQQPLITFLRGQHLTVGLGTYWTANITTVRSDGQVRVLPVRDDGGRIRPYYWVVDAAQFNRTQLGAVRFVVTDQLATIDLAPFQAAVTNTFGAPDHIYHVGRYVVFTWDHPVRGSLGKPVIVP